MRCEQRKTIFRVTFPLRTSRTIVHSSYVRAALFCFFLSIRGTDKNVLNSSNRSCLSSERGRIQNYATRTWGLWTIRRQECVENVTRNIVSLYSYMCLILLHSPQWKWGISDPTRLMILLNPSYILPKMAVDENSTSYMQEWMLIQR